MNILIAEDTPFLQMFNTELMKIWSFDFDMASDGVEAVEFAQKNEGKYDLCLMDVEMPRMNGIEATRIIRKTVKYFPILAYTSDASYKKSCLDVGMDDFSVKPCPHTELFSKINELTVKSIKCVLQGNNIISKEEMPVDKKHAEELRELAKQGLCKMRLRGSGAHDVTFTVHQNVPNSISYDFIEEEFEVATFIDRVAESPSECYLFKSSCLIPVVMLDDEQYLEKCRQEDEKMKHRQKLIKEKKPA